MNPAEGKPHCVRHSEFSPYCRKCFIAMKKAEMPPVVKCPLCGDEADRVNGEGVCRNPTCDVRTFRIVR